MTDDHQPDNPFVASDHPYPRQGLTPAPDTLPDWARVPDQPDPAGAADAWAVGWNGLVYGYFAARRALAADGPDGIPLHDERDELDAWATTYDWASAKWRELLPQGLPDAAYELYHFAKLRKLVVREAMVALAAVLPTDKRRRTVQAATDAAFYGVVAEMGDDEPP